MQIQQSRKPRITALSYHGLSGLIRSLASEYSDRIELTIIDALFDDAAETARRLVADQKVDVFLSAGANSTYLKASFGIPVIRIAVTGVDLMRAILKARRFSEHVAVMTYREPNNELEEIKDLVKADIVQRTYRTLEDAKDAFRELAYSGFRVIIGSSLPVELAERDGLVGVLAYSENSVRQSIEDAIEIANIRSTENQRVEQFNTILAHLGEGVAAVDAEQRVLLMNPAMEALTGLSMHDAQGKLLDQIAPQLSLRETIKYNRSDLERIERVKNRTIVVNRIPIQVNGIVTGAVLTVQDSKVITRVDRNLRARNRQVNFFARYDFSQIVGASPAIESARTLCESYATTASTVLLTGETGTGKELFAQSIHNASNRRSRPFVAVNCASIPDTLYESELFGYEEGAFTGSRKGGHIGLFELAHTGTIFLDEIAEIPPSLQTRLLRVLQEKLVSPLGGDPVPIDVRVIAATNRDLKSAIADGNLREDLYYRLNILRVRLPPLRERDEDVILIASELLKKMVGTSMTTKGAEQLMKFLTPFLLKYQWPGNVRELENVIERLALLFADPNISMQMAARRLPEIVPEFFERRPSEGDPSGEMPDTLKDFVQRAEYQHIREILKECRGNVTEAARRLGLSRTTLWRKLRGSTTGEP